MMLSKEVKRNILLLSLVIISYCISYGLNIFLARHFSPEDYGDLNLIFKLIGIAAPLVLLGTDDSVMRYLPALKEKGDKAKLSGFYRWIFKIMSRMVVATVCVASIMVLLIYFSGHESILGHHYGVTLAAIILPLLAIVIIFDSLLRCYQKYYSSLILGPITYLTVFLVMLTVSFYIFEQVSFYAAFSMLGVSLLCVALVQTGCLSTVVKKDLKNLQSDVAKQEEFANKSSWLKVSVGYMVSGVIAASLGAINLIALEVLGPNEADIGFFSAIFMVASVLLVFPSATSIVVQSRISAFYENGEIKKLQGLLDGAFIFNFALGLIVRVAILVMGERILSGFGAEYVHLQPVLIFLTGGMFFVSLVAIPGNLLLYTEHYKQLLYINITALVCALILNVILIPMYGLVGAVTTFMVVSICTGLVKCIRVKQLLKIKPFVII